jgi:membrane glycosyltransferase
LLLAGGPAMAIPFAMLTAWAPLGRLAVRLGIGRLPEETTTPEELLLLSLPAIHMTAQPASAGSV